MEDPIILVVEDSRYMREFLGNIIMGMGYEHLYFAEDGVQAIEKATLIKPDLITLDISIPIINGLEVVSKVLEVSPKSKIIMISAMHDQGTIKQAIKKGASDFIHKPFQKETLEKVVMSHLKKDQYKVE